jgi:peptidoglycan/xylan/chitin deacetylase (PgdA/CDA1 family)
MYHAVSDIPGPYCMSPAAFRRQVEVIAAAYEVIPLNSLPSELESGSPERRVVLTFDDAFTDFGDTAFPVLAELRLPSTLFVPTGFLGGYNLWDRNTRGWRRRAVLGGGELRRLHETGLVEIGSHTVDHARMSALSIEEMRRQANDSRAALEDLLGSPVLSFSYPYGQLADRSEASSRVLAEAGYRLAVTTHWGTRQSARDLLELRRVHFGEGDGPTAVRRKVDGWYDWIALKERLGYAARRFRRSARPAARALAAPTGVVEPAERPQRQTRDPG